MKNDLILRKLEYTKEEIVQIVSLIKQNLDPEFTEEFFRWKHQKNPFGQSFGLVAFDEEKIIGLRMFMFWEFFDASSKKNIRSLRPVDTVVDKKYRGKGLFRKLTLEGLELCRGNYSLVFNTPNKNSLPGYLKMGWSQLPNSGYFSLGVINPFGKEISVEFLKGRFTEYLPSQNNISTFQNSIYLNWKYSSDEYEKIFSGNNFIVFSKRKLNNVPVLIIYELIGEEKTLQKMLVKLFRITYIPLIYFYNNSSISLKLITVIPRKKAVIIFKDDVLNIKNKILFSLGDLEGKL